MTYNKGDKIKSNYYPYENLIKLRNGYYTVICSRTNKSKYYVLYLPKDKMYVYKVQLNTLRLCDNYEDCIIKIPNRNDAKFIAKILHIAFKDDIVIRRVRERV